MVEILITLAIIGVLAGVIFVAIGNQRQKARISAMKQTAESALSLARECYYRHSFIDKPIANQEICGEVNQEWPELNGNNCEYGDEDGSEYSIICNSYGVKIICGIKSGKGCSVESL
jgi:type II secretory pathway pseudopilin PulG